MPFHVRARGAMPRARTFSSWLEGIVCPEGEPAVPNTRSSPLDGGLPQGRRLFMASRTCLRDRERRVGTDAGTVARDGCVAAARAPARGLEQHYRRLALASAVMLDRDRRLRDDGQADRIGARVPALAGMPGRRPVPEDRLPLLHRVLEPDRRGFAIIATLGDVRRLAPRAVGAALGALGRRARVRRHARPGAARRRSPSTTSSTPGSSGRTSCSRSSCSRSACSSRSRRGTSAASPCRSRVRALALVVGAACGALIVSGIDGDRGRAALRAAVRACRASGSSSRRSTCTSARRRSSAIDLHRARRLARLARSAAISGTPSSCSRCSSCR